MLTFCDFIQVFIFTTNHHLNFANRFDPWPSYGENEQSFRHICTKRNAYVAETRTCTMVCATSKNAVIPQSHDYYLPKMVAVKDDIAYK